MGMHNRREDDNREAEVELNKGYHGADDTYTIKYDDGDGAGLAFESEEKAQEFIDKK